jgi:signal transduction histidine kinase
LSAEARVRALRLFLWAAGAALGIAAEWIYFGWGEPSDWVPDLAVGWTLIAGGLVGWSRRPESRTGVLMAATGFAWFAPNFATTGLGALDWLGDQALYLHRGPLVHVVVAYPRGRTSGGVDRAAVAVGYVAAVVTPIWRSELASVVLAGLIVAAAGVGYLRAVGRQRRARLASLEATGFLAALLAGAAAARLASPTQGVTDATLLAYELALCGLAISLLAGLLLAPWERARVTDLVVELGEARSGTLRDALARALGDPTLEVGYRLPESGVYVDAAGRPLDVASPGSGRRVTHIERDGQVVAALVHDSAVLDDRGLLDAVAAATRLAASNARLQAEVRSQVAELHASRRRLVRAGDDERQRLEQRLHDSAERRLALLAHALEGTQGRTRGGPETEQRIERAEEQLGLTLGELRELAAGLHPRLLSERGLASALRALGERSPVPVELAVPTRRLPDEIEAAVYFVCSEALANMAKYAHASRVEVSVRERGGRLLVEVADDGVGGAVIERGTGLRGLADRVEALGGSLSLESPPGGGTRVAIELPLDGQAR